MRARLQIPIPDLEIGSEAVHTWNIQNYRSLQKKERGPKFDCGGSPWRILLFPFGNGVDHASFYLEHGYEEDEKPEESWYACVQFTLVLWNKNDSSIYLSHSAQHRFNLEESDWGFTRFADVRKMFQPSWEDKGRPMVENEEVNVTAYLRIYKDPTGVLWHNFLNYNSKKETGMVGLKNQGATCYLNSLLQSLFFTNAFRKAVFKIPTEQETDKKTSAYALQRLLYALQTHDDAISTQELTAAFGWEAKDIFEQRDIQELSRVLMDKMEERMKGTEAEKVLPDLFVGKMKTYISCINVDYESSRIEDYWDIQLNVSGNDSLDDSFKDYVQVETMDGENKYQAEGYGLQDAKKGVIFESFPNVLHLQLKRFEYDINRGAMTKVNDRYEFPETFDASPYLSATADKSEPYLYELHGVLVHSGDFNAGHYYAYLKPKSGGPFYKFDDDRVTRSTHKEALDENFGGDYASLINGNNPVRNPYSRTLSTKRSMSAYMLVYIRKSRSTEVLPEVTVDDIPPHVPRILEEEQQEIERRRKEREEAHLYLTVGVVDDNIFKAYEGFDLAGWDAEIGNPATARYLRVLRASTLADLRQTIATEKLVEPDHLRLWIMVGRQNKTCRPDTPLTNLSTTIDQAYAKHSSRDKGFRIWVEEAEVFEDGKPIWQEPSAHQGNAPTLLFLKYFDVDAQTLRGVGHVYLKKQQKVSELIPVIQQRMGWTSPSSKVGLLNGSTSAKSSGECTAPNLMLFEEIKQAMIENMKLKSTLLQSELQDGDIICFQRSVSDKETSALSQIEKLSNAREFYDYLLNRVEVRFMPKFAVDGQNTFVLVLNKKMTYDQFAAKVAEHLEIVPSHIRFLTVHLNTNKPKGLIKRQTNPTLGQALTPQWGSYSNMAQRADTLFYEVLDMSLEELEKKKSLKVWWLTEGISKEESVDLLVPKIGAVKDVVAGLSAKLKLDDDTSRDVRILEVQNCKILREPRMDLPLTHMMDHSIIMAEVVPLEERDAESDTRCIAAMHFDKEPNLPHGVPFKFVIKPVGAIKVLQQLLLTTTRARFSKIQKIDYLNELASKESSLRESSLR